MMRQDYEKLFTFLPAPDPSGELYQKIILRLRREEKFLSLRKRMIIFSFGLIGSVIAFLPAWQWLKTGLVESGFTQFLSLFFSDTGIIAAYWQNFALTLLESLPVMSLAVFLTIAFIFLNSLKSLYKDVKIIFTNSLT